MRNEEDILDTFVRYHTARVDALLVADDGSDDATPRILEGLQASGIPIHVRRLSPSDVFPQAAILTQLIQDAARKLDPDWIVPLDADEFVRGSLDRLAGLDGVVALPWQTYVPTPADAADGDVLDRLVHRKVHEDPQFFKVAISRAVFSHPEFRLGEGSHHVETPAAAAHRVDGVSLAHFPVRSAAQVRRKAGNFLRRARLPDRQPGHSYHLQRLAEECQRCSSMSAQDLQRLAATYAAQEPVDQGVIRDPVRG